MGVPHEEWQWKDVEDEDFVPLQQRGFLCIDLGSGKYPRPHMMHVDWRPSHHVEVVCDIQHLPFADNCFFGLHVGGVVEHFSHHEILTVLKEWYRVCGEWLYLRTMDIHQLCDRYLKHEISAAEFSVSMYGDQDYAGNSHHIGFDMTYLTTMLKAAGFLKIRRVKSPHLFGKLFYAYPYEIQNDLHVIAIKRFGTKFVNKEE